MANYASQFVDPANNYSGGYTSLTIKGNQPHTSNQTRGVIQIEVTSGNVLLQGRVSETAPWITIKDYTESQLEEIVLAPYMQIIVSDAARGWIAETL